jgi:hypothetical protein
LIMIGTIASAAASATAPARRIVPCSSAPHGTARVVTTIRAARWSARRVTPGNGSPSSCSSRQPCDCRPTGACGRTCGDCHRADVTLQVDRECASCHASHHTATAECAACHVPAKAGVHNADVHLSCAGSGCHASAAAPSPTLSRNLCLTCHAAQRTHEPGGVCAECHHIPGSHPGEPSAPRSGPQLKGRP